MNIPLANFKVFYNGHQITKDISDSLISLEYQDKVENETDELEITVEDRELRWQNEWLFDKGATISAEIESGLVLQCGNFSIDELEFNCNKSGDVITVKGLAASITKQMRTKVSTAHENKSFREIVNTIAAKNNLTVIGNIKDIRLQRATQYRQSDLGFLKQLADSFGYTFSVRNDKIIFTDIFELEKKPHVLSIDKTEIISFKMTDKSSDTYNGAAVSHHNPKTNSLIEYNFLQEPEEEYDGFLTAHDIFANATQNLLTSLQNNTPINYSFKSGPAAPLKNDKLVIHHKAENQQQAELMAKSGLHKKNSKEKKGNVVMPGNALLLSGNNIELTGLGKFSGLYHIIAAKHSLSRSAQYVTDCEIKRVASIAATKHYPKKIKSIGAGGTAVTKNVTIKDLAALSDKAF